MTGALERVGGLVSGDGHGRRPRQLDQCVLSPPGDGLFDVLRRHVRELVETLPGALGVEAAVGVDPKRGRLRKCLADTSDALKLGLEGARAHLEFQTLLVGDEGVDIASGRLGADHGVDGDGRQGIARSPARGHGRLMGSGFDVDESRLESRSSCRPRDELRPCGIELSRLERLVGPGHLVEGALDSCDGFAPPVVQRSRFAPADDALALDVTRQANHDDETSLHVAVCRSESGDGEGEAAVGELLEPKTHRGQRTSPGA